MTCVLGMVVRREREIRRFVKTPFYRVVGQLDAEGRHAIEGEFRAVEGSRYFQSPKLYKENGFKEKKDRRGTCRQSCPKQQPPEQTVIDQLDKKKEKEKSAASVQPGRAAERLLAHVQDQPGRDLADRCRSSTRKSSSPIREPMPVCSPAQWQRRSGSNISGLQRLRSGRGICTGGPRSRQL